MKEEKPDPIFEEHLQNVHKYWGKFYNRLQQWMKEDGLEVVAKQTSTSDMKAHQDWMRQYSLNKNATIKKHISSTHTWVKGKERWSKKSNNWHMNPIECAICKMGASNFEEIGSAGDYNEIDLDKGDIPSQDMHGSIIHRTCQEVQDARTEYRKHRKGTKCIQCGTYGCIRKRF